MTQIMVSTDLSEVIKLLIHIKIRIISNAGIFNLQEMIKHSHRSDHHLHLTTIKRISNAGDGYKLLKSLGREKKDTMKYVILDCNIHISKALIAYHIQDTAMERTKFHYILTNLVRIRKYFF
jgi:hypothetical protein